ncbi:hypothetical protein F5Y14DRAFT_193110 [Nemania sp. NC0429]|nr:hypothetical protein F5Y14DRAFT_193110 [Nemania sp. NC0429]
MCLRYLPSICLSARSFVSLYFLSVILFALVPSPVHMNEEDPPSLWIASLSWSRQSFWRPRLIFPQSQSHPPNLGQTTPTTNARCQISPAHSPNSPTSPLAVLTPAQPPSPPPSPPPTPLDPPRHPSHYESVGRLDSTDELSASNQIMTACPCDRLPARIR